MSENTLLLDSKYLLQSQENCSVLAEEQKQRGLSGVGKNEKASFVSSKLKTVGRTQPLLPRGTPQSNLFTYLCFSDDEFRLAFNDVGALSKVASLVSTASGQNLEKVLALITNMAQNDAVRVSICSNGVVAALLGRIASSTEPNLVCALVSPLISLLKSPNAAVHDHIVEKGGVTVVMKLLNKLTGNVSGTLRSADYELLRSLLVTLFFLVASPSTTAKGSLITNGFLKISTTLSQLILPPDVGTQAVLLQVLVCLSVVSTVGTFFFQAFSAFKAVTLRPNMLTFSSIHR